MRLHDAKRRESEKIEDFNFEDRAILYEEDTEEGYEPGVRDWYDETGHKRSDFWLKLLK